MYLVVKKLGRVPITDTKIAWKIGGFGISRNYYYSIEEEDIILLTFTIKIILTLKIV